MNKVRSGEEIQHSIVILKTTYHARPPTVHILSTFFTASMHVLTSFTAIPNSSFAFIPSLFNVVHIPTKSTIALLNAACSCMGMILSPHSSCTLRT